MGPAQKGQETSPPGAVLAPGTGRLPWGCLVVNCSAIRTTAAGELPGPLGGKTARPPGAVVVHGGRDPSPTAARPDSMERPSRGSKVAAVGDDVVWLPQRLDPDACGRRPSTGRSSRPRPILGIGSGRGHRAWIEGRCSGVNRGARVGPEHRLAFGSSVLLPPATPEGGFQFLAPLPFALPRSRQYPRLDERDFDHQAATVRAFATGPLQRGLVSQYRAAAQASQECRDHQDISSVRGCWFPLQVRERLWGPLSETCLRTPWSRFWVTQSI